MPEETDELEGPDEAQIDQSPWRKPESILSILQLIVIVLGALGTSYVFLFLERPPKLQCKQEIVVIDLGLLNDGSGNHVYDVTYNYSLENTGITSLNVDYVILSLFMADVPVLSEEDLVITNQIGVAGPLQWKLVHTEGFSSEAWSNSYISEYSGEKVEFAKNTGGAGDIASKNQAGGHLSFLVKATPKSKIAHFEIRYGINGGEDSDDRFRRYQSAVVGKRAEDRVID